MGSLNSVGMGTLGTRWRLAVLGTLGVTGIVLLCAALGFWRVGVVGAQDDGNSEVTLAITPADTVVREGEVGVFTVTATGLADGQELSLDYRVGPDDDAATFFDVDTGDFVRVSPNGIASNGAIVGVLTLTSESPSGTVAVEAASDDGTDARIRETFMVSVSAGELSASVKAVVNEGVCSRSFAVCTWIIEAVNEISDGPGKGCWNITDADLAAVMASTQRVNLTWFRVSELLAGDFTGMEATTELIIRRHRMTSINDGVWSGLSNLTELRMGNMIRPVVGTPPNASMPLTQTVKVVAGSAPNTVRLEVSEHAPFEITSSVNVVEGGNLQTMEAGEIETHSSLLSTISAGARYSDDLDYSAPVLGRMVTFGVGPTSYPDDVVVFYYSPVPGQNMTLPYDNLYVADPPDYPVFLHEGDTFSVNLIALNRIGVDVTVGATVSVVASDGVTHAPVSARTEFLFPANSIHGVASVTVGDDAVDMEFAQYDVVVTLDEPDPEERYDLFHSSSHQYRVAVLSDGICDRVAPVRDAVLLALSEPNFGSVDCMYVVGPDLLLLKPEGGLTVVDEVGHTFPRGSLVGLGRLREISIQASPETVLEHGFLFLGRSLEKVEITGADSDILGSAAFSGLPLLREVRVSGNFTTVPEGIFRGLSRPLSYAAYVGSNGEIINVPLTLSSRTYQVEGEQREDTEYFVSVPTGAPFTILVESMVRSELGFAGPHSFRIRAGDVESDAFRPSGSVKIDLVEWIGYGKGMTKGFTFVLPDHMNRMDDPPVVVDDPFPVASLRHVEQTGSTPHRFEVSLSAAHDEELMVRYEYGSIRDSDGILQLQENTVHGGGHVTIASGTTAAEFELNLGDAVPVPLDVPLTLYVSLSDPMGSDEYTVSDEDDSVTLPAPTGTTPN